MARKDEPNSPAYLIIGGIRAFDPAEPDAAVDPTTLPILLAFPAAGVKPTDLEFVPAQWVNRERARIRLGLDPGAVLVPSGHYDIWIWVRGLFAQPKWKCGSLSVG